MYLFVEEVQIGAEYEGTVYDFWVTGRLKSGRLIKVFDFIPFDLRSYKGKEIEVLIIAGFLKNKVNSENTEVVISGEFTGEYCIPTRQIKVREDISQKKWFSLKTNDGVFLLNPSEFENNTPEFGETISFCVGRFDLVGLM